MAGKPRSSKLFRHHEQSRSGTARRILIADDFGDYRMLLRLQLDGERFQIVGEASDGREAIDLTREFKPDAIILDVAMPGIDGLHVIPAIRRDCPATKILVLSGFDASWLAAVALELGADAYLQKNGDSSAITAELSALCP